jgi:hypothetical protein
MADEACTFMVGVIQSPPVNDGSFPYPPNLFFVSVPLQRLEEEFGGRRSSQR